MTSPSILSNFSGNAFLNQYLSGYLALHATDPTVTGDGSTEFDGGGYARKLITFSSPSGKTYVSTNGQLYTGLLAGTVNFLAMWTALSGGSMVWRQDISSKAIVVAASGSVHLVAGDVALSV